jgi:hypothetical protein
LDGSVEGAVESDDATVPQSGAGVAVGAGVSVGTGVSVGKGVSVGSCVNVGGTTVGGGVDAGAQALTNIARNENAKKIDRIDLFMTLSSFALIL